MKPSPPGWPRISSALFYDDAARAIDWLCAAFGFSVKIRVTGPDGRIEHSELTYGEGLVMVGQVGGKAHADRPHWRSPQSLGGATTQQLCIYVDDVDAHCAHARAAGAKITSEPSTVDYGADYWSDRNYEAEDPEGHRWWFMQRLRG